MLFNGQIRNLIPSDTPENWDHPGGLPLGTIELTRYGLREAQMQQVADFIARVLVEKEAPENVMEEVIEFRALTKRFITTLIRGCLRNRLIPRAGRAV